jgi:hypothetical protein
MRHSDPSYTTSPFLGTNNYQGLCLGATALSATFSAANERLIHFDLAA